MFMGFSFWYLGNAYDNLFIPSAISFYHREYFLGLRQEEAVFSFGRYLINLKGAYVNGIELVDENGNVIGQYSPFFIGLNSLFFNGKLGKEGWVFGVGPGIITGRIHNWSSYAATINGMVRGLSEDWDVLISVQNLGLGYSSEGGFGKVFTLPEVLALGKKYFGIFGLGASVRFYGDIDKDFGGFVSLKLPMVEIYASPSYKNLTAGMGIQAGFFVFYYSYQHINFLGYGTHRIGISYLFEKQRVFERRFEEYGEMLAKHEKRITELEKKIQELEKGSRAYADELVKQALQTPNPEEALMKLQIARAFSGDKDIDLKIDSLREVIKKNKKEAYLMKEEFPEDTSVDRIIKDIQRKLKAGERTSVEQKANEEVIQKKKDRIKNLLNKGMISEALKIIKTLPPSERRVYIDEWMAKAKKAIAENGYVEAKYYLENVLSVEPNSEAASLLSWVIQQIKEDAASLYIKSLEAYQKGDVIKAYAYIKRAYELQPDNEKYRNVYFRLKNAVER
ncbi:MAG: hypothetical protein ABIL67_04010 [candidate division WOR-3 bacterium]